MAKKKKLITSVAAVATAAAMLLSGTFAWQSINQTALNEASDVINPGGRLHDDFDGTNKDVYVENFADEDIFARIQLSEYFGIIANYGKEGAEKKTDIAGTATLTDGKIVDPEYAIHYFDEDADNAAADYWTWATGGSTVFMPTFNLNKDSLVADINGTYVDAIGGISNRDGTQYTDYTEYTAGQTEEGTEIYDGDTDMDDEVKSDFANLATYEQAGDIVTVPGQEHTAQNTLGATLISMDEWKNTYNSQPGEYWVYDTDGWVYWAQAIEPGTATGLLLDGIALNGVMDDTWYYAINVVAQFVTADDVGKSDNTGFYDTANGTAPSTDAEALLTAIGVDMTGEAGGDNSGETTDPSVPDATLQGLVLTVDGANTLRRTINTPIEVTTESADADLSTVAVYVNEETAALANEEETSTTPTGTLLESGYTYADGILTITDDTLENQTLTVYDANSVVYGSLTVVETWTASVYMNAWEESEPVTQPDTAEWLMAPGDFALTMSSEYPRRGETLVLQNKDGEKILDDLFRTGGYEIITNGLAGVSAYQAWGYGIGVNIDLATVQADETLTIMVKDPDGNIVLNHSVALVGNQNVGSYSITPADRNYWAWAGETVVFDVRNEAGAVPSDLTAASFAFNHADDVSSYSYDESTGTLTVTLADVLYADSLTCSIASESESASSVTLYANVVLEVKDEYNGTPLSDYTEEQIAAEFKAHDQERYLTIEARNEEYNPYDLQNVTYSVESNTGLSYIKDESVLYVSVFEEGDLIVTVTAEAPDGTTLKGSGILKLGDSVCTEGAVMTTADGGTTVSAGSTVTMKVLNADGTEFTYANWGQWTLGGATDPDTQLKQGTLTVGANETGDLTVCYQGAASEIYVKQIFTVTPAAE